jgi:penicillin-binding protein 2
VHLLRSLDVSRPAPAETFSRRRLIELGLGCTLATLVLSARLFQLQIVRGAEHRDQADNNRLRVMPVPAQRGLVYDRHRIAMLRNRPSYTISVLPADLPQRPDVVYRRLAKLIGGSATDFGRLVARARTDPFTRVPLRITTDPQAAHAIEERHHELPGVSVEVEPIREYMDGPLTSHLLGHVGLITEAQLAANGGPNGKYGPNDRLGQGGVEARFEDMLRGEAGQKQAEVDATGREVGVVALDPARPGNNVHLTIDLALQRELQRILVERIDEFEVATAVVVDPWTGGVLAMGHQPAYDNQLFTTSLSEDDFARLLGDPARPMLNGALSSAWPPGSCFKVISALAGLHHQIVQPDTRVHCGGGIRLGKAFRPCWGSHGQQDIISALASSCDTYFYSLVGGESSGRFPGLGADRLAEWARLFGLGAPTGIDLPNELEGVVPDTAWKRRVMKEQWYTGDDWISAIGQGFYTATPLQMAMVAAALANGGTLMKPQLVSELTDSRGRSIRQIAPEPVRRLPADPTNIQLVREGVRAGMLIGKSPYGTSYTGTSFDSKLPEVTIAGKTGTAEYGIEGSEGAAPGKLPTHGWFIFWAPHESPRIAGSVFVKRGRGSQEAAKLAREVVKAYFGVV